MEKEQGSQGGAVIPASWLRGLCITLVVTASIVAAYFIVGRYLRVAATILLLAGMLAFLLQPVVDLLTRWSRIKSPHTARITAVLVIYLVLGTAVFTFSTVAIRAIVRDYTALSLTWMDDGTRIPVQLQRLQDWYQDTVPQDVRTQIQERLKNELSQSPEKYFPTLLGWFKGVATKAGEWFGLLIELIFVPLIAFYFLTDSSRIREQVLFFVPHRYRNSLLQYTGGVSQILRRYVQSQLLLCLIAWVVVTIALLLMRIPGALILGIWAGLSRAIPMVGPVVGAIPLLIVVLANPVWGQFAWAVLLGFAALHLFESKYLMPRILGDTLNIHPVLIIVSLLVGYEILGLLGMFLAPPTVAIVRYILAIRRGESPAPLSGIPLPVEENPPKSPEVVPPLSKKLTKELGEGSERGYTVS